MFGHPAAAAFVDDASAAACSGLFVGYKRSGLSPQAW